MGCKIVLLIVIISLQTLVICENNKGTDNADLSKEEAVFVPTNTWQVIKKGQSIPKGLHIRINMQTGLKEAKLLDATEKQDKPEGSNALLELHSDGEEKEEPKQTNLKSYSPEELKIMLKNINSDENLPPIDEHNVKRVKEKFKDYTQLKKELGDLNMSVKSDSEILRDLFNNFKDVTSNNNLNSDQKDAEILSILENFEYLVHQIDNANDFLNLNGFTEIIHKNLNSSNTKIKSETLHILGSCVQNNAKAQINVLESGALNIVLRLLAIDSSDEVKMRAVYSLSSLLRRFPLAQKQFIKNGGLNVFGIFFSKPENMKLQLKVITLIYDLLMEQNEAFEDRNRTDFQENSKQYEAVDLKNTLIKNDWCKIFNNVLINNAKIEHKDHDAIERCLNLMLLVTDKCLTTFHNKNLLNTLQKFHENYETLSEEEIADDPDSFLYFTNLKNITHHLLSIVSSVKTEL